MSSDDDGVPKLIGFDLDGCIWSPEMYELWGGGAPFRHEPVSNELKDRNSATVRLLGATAHIMHHLKTDPRFTDTKVAWVSCCDEPRWAAECLGKFTTSDGETPLAQCVHSSHIYKHNKQVHFQRLRAEFPHVEFEQMLFFDNEAGNIRNVSKIGVKCMYAPDGMTMEAWEQGLALFK
jgi:magnesium-dependent phosphatase 1